MNLTLEQKQKISEYHKKWYLANSSKVKAYSKLWVKNNRDRYFQKKNAYKKTPRGRFIKYNENARLRGYEFTLQIEFFSNLINGNCHYCGLKTANGIDRIDNTKGYIESNVISCCKICNTMKMALSYEDFKKHIKNIYNHLLT